MTSELIYLGDLSVKAIHKKSGDIVLTDAPIDNNGKGKAFSPTDTLATSLASCMLTIMGIKCRDKQINMLNATASVNKIMASNPRRVAEIQVDIHMPSGITESERKLLIASAKACPVAKSIHPDIIQKITFTWDL